MNTQEFLQVVTNGSKGEISNYVHSIANEADFKAFQETLPERPANMSKEEKVDLLVSLITQLAELEEKKRHDKLKQLLEYQTFSEKEWDILITYINREEKSPAYNPENNCLLYLDAFLYGLICGKRAVRARKKRDMKAAK